MMKEAVKAIAALSGRNVIVAAPSSSAVGILKKDDFSKSDTVQRFMLDELLQEAARGQVLWVDDWKRMGWSLRLRLQRFFGSRFQR